MREAQGDGAVAARAPTGVLAGWAEGGQPVLKLTATRGAEKSPSRSGGRAEARARPCFV